MGWKAIQETILHFEESRRKIANAESWSQSCSNTPPVIKHLHVWLRQFKWFQGMRHLQLVNNQWWAPCFLAELIFSPRMRIRAL